MLLLNAIWFGLTLPFRIIYWIFCVSALLGAYLLAIIVIFAVISVFFA
jgi:hypothetical protein